MATRNGYRSIRVVVKLKSTAGRTSTTTALSGSRALDRFTTAVSPGNETKFFLRLVAEKSP